MTTEEKAKAYDEAVEKLGYYCNSPRTCVGIDIIQDIFSELKESGEERIRKAIESIIRVYEKTRGEWFDGYDMDTLVVHLRDAFACLEKQKEQNHDGKKWIREKDYNEQLDAQYAQGFEDGKKEQNLAEFVEDERIRKTLLRCCDDWDKGQFGCMKKEDVPLIRAYLERHKAVKKIQYELDAPLGQDINGRPIHFEDFQDSAECGKDERIRKNCIHFLELQKSHHADTSEIDDCIAYLERQKDSDKAMSAIEKIDKYIDSHTANAHDMDDSNPDKKYYSGVDDTLSDISGILIDIYTNFDISDLENQKAKKDYRKLYEDIAQSGWFKKAHEGKSLGGEFEQKKYVNDLSPEQEAYLMSERFKDAENEKVKFTNREFLLCLTSFNGFREGEYYWLEYLGGDMYVGRSDNVLRKKFHITPMQLFTNFSTMSVKLAQFEETSESQQDKPVARKASEEDEEPKENCHAYRENDDDTSDREIAKYISYGELPLVSIEHIEGLDTDFEKQVGAVIASAMNREHQFTSKYIKWTAQRLMECAKDKHNSEDECVSDNSDNKEWSEDDKTRLKVIKEELERYIILNQYGTPLSVDDIDWLKNLPERFNLHWKPSDEQMKALWCATRKHLEFDNEKARELRGKVLESLYDDLRKL